MKSGTRDFDIIRSPEKLRAIAHRGRLDIIRCLMGRAMTGTQVAAQLGLPATRVHYHLNQLRRAGLLEEASVAADSGRERYYTASARHYLLDPAIGSTSEDAVHTMRQVAERAFLDWRRKEVLGLDYGEVASLIVNDCLRVLPDEQVFVLFMPPGEELAEAVVVELEALGARPRVKFWSHYSLLRTLDRHTPASLAELPFMHPDDVAGLSAGVCISSAVPPRAVRPPTPEHLAKLPHQLKAISAWYKELRRQRVRYVELLLPERAEFFDETRLDETLKQYWQSVTNDYRTHRVRAQRLLRRIGSQARLRLRGEGATDLTIDVDLGRPHISDGVVSGEDIAGGRVFDHLPAGALILLPSGNTARGVWHADYTFLGGQHFRDLTITVEKGRAVKIDSPHDVEPLQQLLKHSAGEVNRVAFIAIGVNDPAGQLTGKAGLDMCVDGTVTIGFGNNECYGGDVASTRDFIAPATQVIVDAGGERVLPDA